MVVITALGIIQLNAPIRPPRRSPSSFCAPSSLQSTEAAGGLKGEGEGAGVREQSGPGAP